VSVSQKFVLFAVMTVYMATYFLSHPLTGNSQMIEAPALAAPIPGFVPVEGKIEEHAGSQVKPTESKFAPISQHIVTKTK
jgi:hypothetical protein